MPNGPAVFGTFVVGDRNHLLARQALLRRNRAIPEAVRHSLIVNRLDVVRPAAAGLEKYAFSFGNPAELDAQPQRHQIQCVGFPHRPHHRDLSGLRIREDVFVAADRLSRLPESVADFDDLRVLRVLDVLGERRQLRIVLHDGVQVLIDDAFKARAIAV